MEWPLEIGILKNETIKKEKGKKDGIKEVLASQKRVVSTISFHDYYTQEEKNCVP